MQDIIIHGAAEHNLKNIDVTIPRDKLTVVTGLSGSGKSSLAFDTLYAEGQRRYVESLSAYARQFLDRMGKPKVRHIEGLSPSIAIEQRSAGSNPRSTVATVTEIYDYLRLLYAHVGTPHCPKCGKVLAAQSAQRIRDRLLQLPAGPAMMILAPVVRGRKGNSCINSSLTLCGLAFSAITIAGSCVGLASGGTEAGGSGNIPELPDCSTGDGLSVVGGFSIVTVFGTVCPASGVARGVTFCPLPSSVSVVADFAITGAWSTISRFCAVWFSAMDGMSALSRQGNV